MHKAILVIDSSVIIKWLSSDREENLDYADNILIDAQNDKVKLIAPKLAKYEVGNVLLFSKNLSPEQVKTVLVKFYNLPLSFMSESEELAKETFELAFNLRITYYDASFLSLAQQYGANLVTENIKHQGKDLAIKVIPLSKYK
jgi:predicted nucleic acid-binding protein